LSPILAASTTRVNAQTNEKRNRLIYHFLKISVLGLGLPLRVSLGRDKYKNSKHLQNRFALVILHYYSQIKAFAFFKI